MNLTLVRGDDQTIPLKFWNGDTPQDITGWTIFFTVKLKVEDSDDNAVLKKDVTSHTNPTQGETEIVITHTECDALAAVYFYDIQYKDGSGKIKTVMIGSLEFVKDITRRIS